MDLLTVQNSDVALEPNSMKDILVQYETGLPKRGDVLTGEVISSNKSSILVDLGTLGTGIIYPSEFYDNPNLHKSLKPRDKISVILLDMENEDGYRELSLKQAQMTTAWEDIKEKKEKSEVIPTTILNMNKGGLIVEINGIQGFLPLSQLAPEHYPKVEGGDITKIVQALQKFRSQIFNVKILDFSEEENKLIVSEKAIMTDKLKDEIGRFKVGDIIEGIVTDITDFGAFINIRPGAEIASPDIASLVPPVSPPSSQIEGLIHISEIDWKMVENPKDYLTVGEKISAKIVGINNDRISLSLKALKLDPWEKIEERFKVGDTVEGEIAKSTSYGLLVKVSDQIIGLIPASEVSNKKDWSLKIGDKISVAIVTIESKEHKMLLTTNPTRSDLGSSERLDIESEQGGKNEKKEK